MTVYPLRFPGISPEHGVVNRDMALADPHLPVHSTAANRRPLRKA